MATRARRDQAGKDTLRSEDERRGLSYPPRPPGPLVWFHVGLDEDAGAVFELAARVAAERPDIQFLLTTDTDQKPEARDGVTVTFVPIETMPAARRFLDHWQPDVAVWTELDIRPALAQEAHDRKIPLLMVAADPTLRRPTHGWPRAIVADVLTMFQTIIAGDERSATTLRQLGAQSTALQVIGYLQEGTPAPRCNETERDDMAATIAGRPTWLAMSVTEGEFADVVAAHERGLTRSHRLLLLLVPDQPELGPQWAQQLSEQNYSVALRSEGETPEPSTQVYVADTEGEAGLWYRLAPISFLGRSLVDAGGVNPFEGGRRLGSAIVHGRHVAAHRAAYDRLAKARAARAIATPDRLGAVVEELLSPARAAELAHQAWSVASEGADVTDRVMDLILTEIEAR
ncbi:MAG: glycosyltransferase N-terminal domain-containing protein [Pseudomonadota bacterium]